MLIAVSTTLSLPPIVKQKSSVESVEFPAKKFTKKAKFLKKHLTNEPGCAIIKAQKRDTKEVNTMTKKAQRAIRFYNEMVEDDMINKTWEHEDYDNVMVYEDVNGDIVCVKRDTNGEIIDAWVE